MFKTINKTIRIVGCGAILFAGAFAYTPVAAQNTADIATLTIRSNAKIAAGKGAKYHVSLNGKVIRTIDVTKERRKGEFQRNTIKLQKPGKNFKITLTFANDVPDKRDRSLFIYDATLNGKALRLGHFSKEKGCGTYRQQQDVKLITFYCKGKISTQIHDGVQQKATRSIISAALNNPKKNVPTNTPIKNDPPKNPPSKSTPPKNIPKDTPVVSPVKPTPLPAPPTVKPTPIFSDNGNGSCSCQGGENQNNMAAATMASYRFGFGPKSAQDLQNIAKNPRCWLKAQVCNKEQHQTPSGIAAMPYTMKILFERSKAGSAQRDVHTVASTRKNIPTTKVSHRQLWQYESSERMLAAIETNSPFVERWVQFWSNHFTAAASDNFLKAIVGSYEREVIRQYKFANLGEMALAMAKHPTMLLYLNNNTNSGNNSVLGKRNPGQYGLNENFGREIIELYCIGANSGPGGKQVYTETDVVEASKILSGWRIPKYRQGADIKAPPRNSFTFDEKAHEPGNKTVLGRKYGQGLKEGERFVRELCANQYSANFIATKLARHFISDTPPAAAVKKLEAAFMKSGGNLQTLALTLIDMPEAWNPNVKKFGDANYYLTSLLRLLVDNDNHKARIYTKLNRYLDTLNQQAWHAAFPEGWCDKEECWLSGQTLVDRLNISNEIIRMLNVSDTIKDLLEDISGQRFSIDRLDDIEQSNPAQCASLQTGNIIKGCTIRAAVAAESPNDAYLLLLNSPERTMR